MPNIIHRIGSDKTTLEKAYNSIATIDGLTQWWTTQVSGKSEIGEVIEFRFGEGGPDFQVIDLQINNRVEWKCVIGPPEWVDTHIEFDLYEEEEEVVITFKHSGWREEVEFMHHCSTQWAYFLIGLKKLLETGKGTPFGAGIEPISSWTKE